MTFMNLEFPDDPYVDIGTGGPMILLHGLFGSLSNWRSVMDEFKSTHRVIIPRLPLFSSPISNERIYDLVEFVGGFIESRGLNKVVLIGNSLGGHIALLCAWKYPQLVEKLVLTGSSGLFEHSFGGSFPRIKNYDYVRERVENTFFKREVATKELVDQVYDTLQSPSKILTIVRLAKEAQRHNVSDLLNGINTPTLLVWGKNDTITPPEVAMDFHRRLPRSSLVLLDDCGHVPMMEQPEQFNIFVRMFLDFRFQKG